MNCTCDAVSVWKYESLNSVIFSLNLAILFFVRHRIKKVIVTFYLTILSFLSELWAYILQFCEKKNYEEKNQNCEIKSRNF